ncbi:MAG: serine/threonine-protein kinase [Elusimicrobiota bacterium]
MSIFCSKCGESNKDSAKFCCGCGGGLITASSSSGPLTPGTLLENRYKITTLIKTGGMGAVYKANDKKFDNICAVKEFLPPFGNPQEQQQAAVWFQREARILNKMDHPNLPKVSDYFVNNGRYYLVMNFIDGQDLETKLSCEGKPGLPFDKVVEWSKQVLQVLDYLHSQNPPIVYRDIKPGNIMLHKDGRIMLIDFGIARSISQDSQTKKTVIGTSGYAPAEQCRGNAEPRSDLYALGATMHHLITGIEPLPFRFDPLINIIPSIASNLNDIVMKALKDNVNERFSSAKEMFEKLNIKKQEQQKVISIPQQTSTSIPVFQPSRLSLIDKKWLSFGAEVIFDSLSGVFKSGESHRILNSIDKLDNMTLSGKYMSVKLLRCFLNIKLKRSYDGKIRSFTILEVLFHNMWDRRLDIPVCSVNMIDSKNFQHKSDVDGPHSFTQVKLSNGKTIETEFPYPEFILEDHAKTKGFLWFDSLPEDTFPHRFLFEFTVYDQIQTGWPIDCDLLEFIIENYQIKPIKDDSIKQ